MIKKRFVIFSCMLFLVCLITTGIRTTAVPAQELPTGTGTYDIAPVNQFSSSFSITVQGIDKAGYYNVYKKSLNTFVGSTPVSIDEAINSMPSVYENIDDLEVWIYSDIAEASKLAVLSLNSSNQLELTSSSVSEQDECFIATAAFGSKYHPEVVILRHFRDEFLMTNRWGREFVKYYYKHSPVAANIIRDYPGYKVPVRIFLIPFVLLALLFLNKWQAWLLLLVILGVGFLRKKSKEKALNM